jgi:predicted component of type VI protein secretion system
LRLSTSGVSKTNGSLPIHHPKGKTNQAHKYDDGCDAVRGARKRKTSQLRQETQPQPQPQLLVEPQPQQQSQSQPQPLPEALPQPLPQPLLQLLPQTLPQTQPQTQSQTGTDGGAVGQRCLACLQIQRRGRASRGHDYGGLCDAGNDGSKGLHSGFTRGPLRVHSRRSFTWV